MAGPTQVPGNVIVPDGGWGWVVVLSSFLLQFLTIGITYTFGVMLVALTDPINGFGTGESETAWIGSIQPCLLYFTGKEEGVGMKERKRGGRWSGMERWRERVLGCGVGVERWRGRADRGGVCVCVCGGGGVLTKGADNRVKGERERERERDRKKERNGIGICQLLQYTHKQ